MVFFLGFVKQTPLTVLIRGVSFVRQVYANGFSVG